MIVNDRDSSTAKFHSIFFRYCNISEIATSSTPILTHCISHFVYFCILCTESCFSFSFPSNLFIPLSLFSYEKDFELESETRHSLGYANDSCESDRSINMQITEARARKEDRQIPKAQHATNVKTKKSYYKKTEDIIKKKNKYHRCIRTINKYPIKK